MTIDDDRARGDTAGNRCEAKRAHLPAAALSRKYAASAGLSRAGEFARRAMVAVRPRGRLAQAVHEMCPLRLSL